MDLSSEVLSEMTQHSCQEALVSFEVTQDPESVKYWLTQCAKYSTLTLETLKKEKVEKKEGKKYT